MFPFTRYNITFIIKWILGQSEKNPRTRLGHVPGKVCLPEAGLEGGSADYGWYDGLFCCNQRWGRQADPLIPWGNKSYSRIKVHFILLIKFRYVFHFYLRPRFGLFDFIDTFLRLKMRTVWVIMCASYEFTNVFFSRKNW